MIGALGKIGGLATAGNIGLLIDIGGKIVSIVDKIFEENTREELKTKYHDKGVKAKIEFEDCEIFVLVREKKEQD